MHVKSISQLKHMELLIRSEITPSRYRPTEFVKEARHAAVFCENKLLLTTGWADDKDSLRQAKALANSMTMQDVVGSLGFSQRLDYGVISGKSILWQNEHYSLSAKPSNSVDYGEDGGPLLAIIFESEKGLPLAYLLSIHNDLASIFE